MSTDKKRIIEKEPEQNKKRASWIIILLCVICIIAVITLYYIFTGSSHETMKWARKLSPEDVSCIELVIFPQDMDKQYKILSDEELKDAVVLINESKGRYLANPEDMCGGAISLYLHMKDGSEHTVTNIGNVYLSIDGDHYAAGYGWLSSWPYKEGDSPLPYDFYGTPVLIPGEYVAFQAEILEINDSSMIVRPLPGSPELDSADQFSLPVKNMPPSPEAKVGDIIEIQYNGEILESYPAQLGVIYGTSVITEKE